MTDYCQGCGVVPVGITHICPPLPSPQYGRDLLGCANCNLLAAELDRVRERRGDALKALTQFYDDHAEGGEPPCPCRACEMARKVFAAVLADVDSERPTKEASCLTGFACSSTASLDAVPAATKPSTAATAKSASTTLRADPECRRLRKPTAGGQVCACRAGTCALGIAAADVDSEKEPDPTAGMPPDLVRVLRDPTITIPLCHKITMADGRTLFEHLEEWRNASSNTASGLLPADVDSGQPEPAENMLLIEEMEARADALIEYGNALPDGVSTEAFAEAANLRREAAELRGAVDSGQPE